MINTTNLSNDELKYELIIGLRNEVDRYDAHEKRNRVYERQYFQQFCDLCFVYSPKFNYGENLMNCVQNNNNKNLHDNPNFAHGFESITTGIKNTDNIDDVKDMISKFNKYKLKTA